MSSFTPFDWKSVGPCVAGVDEAGRGCLAGPVYAGAVLLREDPSTSIQVYRDSKTLSEKRREELFEILIQEHWVGVGSASAKEIDEMNILNASFLAMKRAVNALCKLVPAELNAQMVFLVDGNLPIPGLGRPQQTLVKGDLRATPVAAASIAAKVSRDRFMREAELQFPEYQFAVHKGYGTVLHREIISRSGPCSLHRRSFRGVKE